MGDEQIPSLSRGMWKRFLAGMVAIVFFAAAGTATAVLMEIDEAVDIFRQANLPIAGVSEVLDDVDAGQPQTILVIGSDRRWGDKKAGIKPRSDTLLLARLDPSKEVTALLAIPRDLKVTYRGAGGSTREDKINAAYAIGGERAVVRKVKELFGEGFPIHHVVNVNFNGFQRGVNALNCVYVDVDRRYFNDNDPPTDSPYNYAEIDLQPGYQRLCGSDALDYVRYRHGDTDIVRSARQEDFLSQAKSQIGVEQLFRDRKKLLRIFGEYTRTDIRDTTATLRLLKLAYSSSQQPIRRIRFRGELGEVYVTSTAEDLARMREQFLNAESPKGPAKRTTASSGSKKRSGRRGGGVPGLVEAKSASEDAAAPAAVELSMPVYAPRYLLRTGEYFDGHGSRVARAYHVYAPGAKKHEAYRLVARDTNGVGEYYGIQGTTWRDPPMLQRPSETRTVGGRKLDLFWDGSRLRLVAWRTRGGVYWVSNTLTRSLTNRQMLALTRSLRKVG